MNNRSPWFSLLYLVFAYAAIVFVVSLLAVSTMGFAVVFSYAIFFPMAMLSGAWAVLGPGSYLVRTASSIGAVLAIFFGGAFALFLSALASRNAFGEEMMPWEVLIVTVCFGIPLIVAAQIPYWAARLIFGWQLIDEAKPAKAKRLDIKEMLAITAVLAVVLVAPSQAASRLSSQFVRQVEIGDVRSEAVTDPNTGEVTFEEVEITTENIEAYKMERAASMAQGQQFGIWLVLGYGVVITISSLVNIPCFYIGMKVCDAGTALIWSIVYWLGIFFVLFVCMAVITRPPGNILGEATLYLMLLGILFALSAAMPMYVARLNGVKLVRRSDFRDSLQNEKTATFEKTPDPFGD